MEHPAITQTMRTGYPEIDYLEHERYRNANYKAEDYPVEDYFGSEIQAGDKYIMTDSGHVVLEGNIRDYLQETLGAVFYEAK
ncbi:YqaI family protein [Sporosarcina sp. USHLN248]|uniref:YqaI family protein n=1 Tax=Sporosarcina sp. USHLN248 TaxID=3081300 RepID=UPI00301A3BA7